MSREILFKAKRVDNGKWVEGHLVKLGSVYWIYTGKVDRLNSYTNGYGTTIYPPIKYMIEPKTICQYIGLTDKNGEKIWENDIVEISEENGYFKLEWEENTARWVMNNEAERFIVHFDNYWAYEVEVIGNIFGNPELLKGGANE